MAGKQEPRECFEPSEGRLLRWLKMQQVETSAGPIAKFSQKELADEYGVSVTTVNTLLRRLAQARCVEYVRSGRYRVTEVGEQVLQKMDDIKEIIGRDSHAD